MSVCLLVCLSDISCEKRLEPLSQSSYDLLRTFLSRFRFDKRVIAMYLTGAEILYGASVHWIR